MEIIGAAVVVAVGIVVAAVFHGRPHGVAHGAAEREYHRCPVTLRISVTERADERAAVAHDGIGDQRGGRGHGRLSAGQQGRHSLTRRSSIEQIIRALTPPSH